MEVYRQQFSKDCPRTDLEPENLEAAEVLRFSIAETLRPLAPKMLDSLCSGWPAEDRMMVMRRVESALADPGVVAILSPKPEPRE